VTHFHIRRVRILAFAALLLLGGCSAQAAMEKIATPRIDRFSREYLARVARGDVTGAARLVDPEVMTPEADYAVRVMGAAFGNRKPAAVDLINASASAGRFRRTDLVYQYTFPQDWVIAEVITDDSAGVLKVVGAHAESFPRRLEAENALTLRGKPVGFWILALLAVAMPVICIVEAVRVVRSGMKRRWLWAFVSLLAGCTVAVNWTTGQASVQPFFVQFLGFGIVRKGGPYVPWTLSIALPLGAIWAETRLRSWRRTAAAAAEATASAGANAAPADPGPAPASAPLDHPDVSVPRTDVLPPRQDQPE
jgi:hypothetical protein